MEFRLIYQGPLYAQQADDSARQSRLKHKFEIRRSFHKQLEQLWKLDSRLKEFWKHWEKTKGTESDNLSKLYQRRGITWIPLVQERIGIVCNLNILFLRHEPKGGIVHAGDLDNRIKTLFDSLTMPSENEIPDDIESTNEPNPFFCLLSDDKLITDFRVTADRLLIPSANPVAEVHLVIEVRTFIADHEKATWYLLGEIHR